MFLASSTQRTHHEIFKSFYQESLFMNVSETVTGIDNNTHLLDLAGLNVSSRGVFRTMSNILRWSVLQK